MRIGTTIALASLVGASLVATPRAHAKTENISPVRCVPANGAPLAYNNAFLTNISGGNAGVICPLRSVPGSGALNVTFYYSSSATVSCAPAGSFSPTGSVTWFPAQSGSGTNGFFVWNAVFGGESQTHYNIHCTLPNNATVRGIVENGGF
jgi:hypothetical protein